MSVGTDDARGNVVARDPTIGRAAQAGAVGLHVRPGSPRTGGVPRRSFLPAGEQSGFCALLLSSPQLRGRAAMDRRPALLDPIAVDGSEAGRPELESWLGEVHPPRRRMPLACTVGGCGRGIKGSGAVWAPRDQMEQGRSTTESRLGRDTDPPSGRSRPPRTRQDQAGTTRATYPECPLRTDGPSHHLCRAHLRSWVRAGRPTRLEAWYVPLVQRPRIRLGRLRPPLRLEVALRSAALERRRHPLHSTHGRRSGRWGSCSRARGSPACSTSISTTGSAGGALCPESASTTRERGSSCTRPARGSNGIPARRRRPMVDPVPAGPLGLAGPGRVQTTAARARLPAHRPVLAATAR